MVATEDDPLEGERLTVMVFSLSTKRRCIDDRKPWCSASRTAR